MRMIFKYIEITFKYFDLLFSYLAVKTLKPLTYLIAISTYAIGLFGFVFIIIGLEELGTEWWKRTRDPASDIFFGIFLLLLTRFLYFLANWIESVKNLEILTREETQILKRSQFWEESIYQVEKLEKFDHLRRMDLGYFRPKFWFIDEDTFLEDLSNYKKHISYYHKNKIKNDESPHWHIHAFQKENLNNFKSRYEDYRNLSDRPYNNHYNNFLKQEIENYVHQIKRSIASDETILGDKKKKSLKKRIENQKKLIELINDDPRQFIIEYIYRYYYEKHRYHPKRLEALRAVDRKIKYKLDSETPIEIRTNFIEPNMECFAYEYHYIFSDE